MAQDAVEEQDYKLQLAHKAGWRAKRSQFSRAQLPLTAPSPPLLQRFLFRTQDVADVDRSRLQREILDLVQQHGAAAAGGGLFAISRRNLPRLLG